MPPHPVFGSGTRRILPLTSQISRSQALSSNPKTPHILSIRLNQICTLHNPHRPHYTPYPTTNHRQKPPLNRNFTTTLPLPSSSSSTPAAQTTQPPQHPSPLSIEKFHTLADTYIDNLVLHLEQLQEEREDVDVEYSVCLPHLSPPSPSLPS